MFKRLTVILAFLMTLSSSVMAQDFQKGLAAYNAGDQATALQEWTPLAEAGDADAQFTIGVMHRYGRGVPQDYKDSLKWRRLAAEQKDKHAHSLLGTSYQYGYGVLPNNIIAHMWYNIASANRRNPSRTFMDWISEKMTPADISKAQAMARECMNSGYTKCGY